MEIGNDRKVKNIKRISIRNLHLEQKEAQPKSAKIADISRKTQARDDKSPRRKSSLLQHLASLDEPSGSGGSLKLHSGILIDSFVSIHTKSMTVDESLLYISEVQKANINPDFSTITFPDTPRTKRQELIIRVWCRSMQLGENGLGEGNQWRLVFNYKMNLKSLRYIGGSIKNMEDYFYNNSIIVKINDSYYTDSKHLKIGDAHIESMNSNKNRTSLPSYTFHSIRAINNLMERFNEVKLSKSKISREIEKYEDTLTSEDDSEYITARKEQLKYEIAVLDKNITKQRQENDILVTTIISTKVKIEDMKELIDHKIPSMVDVCSNNIEVIDSQIESLRENLGESIYPSLKNQIRDKVTVLQDMIPIENADNGLLFIILGNKFPSTIKELTEACYHNKSHSFFEDAKVDISAHSNYNQNIECINACLSFIAQLLVAVATIMNLKLENAIFLRGSRSLIFDPLICQQLPKITEQYNFDLQESADLYPLYYDDNQTEKVLLDGNSPDRRFVLKNLRFEHALTLLNKNLISITNNITEAYDSYNSLSAGFHKHSNGVPIDSTDNLLWNIKFLLLFITAP